jgi:hypothetical protein
MTRKITISVPDDVAARLDQVDNVSAYFTALARRDLRRETGLRQLSEAGFELSPDGMDRARDRLRAAAARLAAGRRDGSGA